MALTTMSPRVLSCYNVAPINVTLPSVAEYTASQKGGPHFVVLNHGASTVAVKKSTGATLVTLTAGQVAIVLFSLTDVTYILRNINTARTIHHSTRGAVTNPAGLRTFSPTCLSGSLCDIAASAGMVPLDGRDGRLSCIVPMCIDNIAECRNSTREPIRAADIVMPSVVPVKFTRGQFSADPLHPEAGTVLPLQFYDALHQNDSAMNLVYAGILTGANNVSRSPLHLRLGGTGASFLWNHGDGASDLLVTRHLWQKLVNYVGDDGATYQIDIRFIAEHTLDPEPSLPDPAAGEVPTYTGTGIAQYGSPLNYLVDSAGQFLVQGFQVGMQVRVTGYTGGGYNGIATIVFVSAYVMQLDVALTNDSGGSITIGPVHGPGGQMDTAKSAWGTLFFLHVFCNQILNNFADGDTSTPSGAPGPIAFRRSDPVVSGLAFGVGGTEDQKFYHPQLVLTAALPTSFHASMGHSWIPLDDRTWIREYPEETYTLAGRNLEFVHKLRNGSPWIDPVGCTAEDYPRAIIELADIAGNICFGHAPGGANNYAGMSLGGGFPSSRPIEFLCWENGDAEGRTYLVPTKPGWSETCGVLDVAGGSSASVSICTIDKYGIDDGTGRRHWSGAETDIHYLECDGHPDEPFEGIGGGHSCFNNGNSADSGNIANCCISTVGDAVAQVTDKCVSLKHLFGDFTGSGCEDLGQTCEVTNTGVFQMLLEYEDHTYVMGGNQRARSISWVRFLPDPARGIHDYVHVGGGSNEMVDVYSTWATTTGTITCSGTASGTSLKGFVKYDHVAEGVLGDTTVNVTFQTAKTTSQGVGSRVSSVSQGYFGVIVPTGGNNATVSIRKFVGGVETVLASVNITNLTSATVAVIFKTWGCDLTLTWTVSGQSTQELTAVDAEICTNLGESGLALFSTGTSATFTALSIQDQTKQFSEIGASLGWTTMSLSWPATVPEARASFSTACTDSDSGTGCGTPPKCNCFSTSHVVHQSTTVVWTGNDIFDFVDGRDLSEPACEGGTGSGMDDPITTTSGGQPDCGCEDLPCASSGVEMSTCGDCPPPWRCISLSLPSCFTESVQESEPRMCGGVSSFCKNVILCD